ncbi:hypothetical protein LXL04_014762 [Taraxacum kok-saghyz]
MDSLNKMISGLNGKIMTLEEKQDTTNLGVWYLCNMADGNKLSGTAKEQFRLAGKSRKRIKNVDQETFGQVGGIRRFYPSMNLDIIDPYVLIQYKSEEHNSTIAKGEGSKPSWNEKLKFRVEFGGGDEQPKLGLIFEDNRPWIFLIEVLELGVDNGTSKLQVQKV